MENAFSVKKAIVHHVFWEQIDAQDLNNPQIKLLLLILMVESPQQNAIQDALIVPRLILVTA